MSFADAPPLANAAVELVALSQDHHDDLVAAVCVGELWKRAWYSGVPSPDEMAEVIDERVARQAAGEKACWAILDPATGRAVGMTNYWNLDPANRRVEIGGTWVGRAYQGTMINPGAKLLLLERAFDELGCIAVEFRTHWHNLQSRGAIAKLGAKQDGVLRSHQIMKDGSLRDTVVFSILDIEWPAVRTTLTARLTT